jgi:serine/threonine protein kinase
MIERRGGDARYAPAPMLGAGAIVADRFRMIRQLGDGAMGSVWLAHDVRLDTPCALKLVHNALAGRHDIRARFEREAKAAARLRSSHVVQILDYGVWNDLQYIAMELLEGESLEERLCRRGSLSAAETIAVILQIARALMKAHAAGLVHRDLTPNNIFLVTEDDHEIVKVLDFGIVKSPLPTVHECITAAGVMIGTPLYMSPEQAQGLTCIDYRSDLWSLAVIAFRCVTGRLPFDSEALGELVMQIVVNELPTPSRLNPSVPPGFDAWWARAAVRDPALRFRSAKELADSLAFVLGLSAEAIRPIPIPPAAPRFHAPPPSAHHARSAREDEAPPSRGGGWRSRAKDAGAALAIIAFVALLTVRGSSCIESFASMSVEEPAAMKSELALKPPSPAAASAAPSRAQATSPILPSRPISTPTSLY